MKRGCGAGRPPRHLPRIRQGAGYPLSLHTANKVVQFDKIRNAGLRRTPDNHPECVFSVRMRNGAQRRRSLQIRMPNGQILVQGLCKFSDARRDEVKVCASSDVGTQILVEIRLWRGIFVLNTPDIDKFIPYLALCMCHFSDANLALAGV